MSLPSPEQPEAERQRRQASGWRGFLRRFRLSDVESSSQRGRHDMSTTEFEAVDILAGPLHPNWENRKAEMIKEANRPFVSRLARWAVQGVVGWWRADEASITDGDTMLIVDEEEMRHPQPLSPQQKADIEASVAAFEGVGPIQTDFYKQFQAPGRTPDGQPTEQR